LAWLRNFLVETELNAFCHLKLTGLCLFLKPLKQQISEAYCSFTVVKNIKYQVDGIISGNSSKNNQICVYLPKLGG
jgi:hypothetical protein